MAGQHRQGLIAVAMRNGNGKPNAFTVIQGSAEQALRSSVPAHLAETSWVKHEAKSSRAAFRDVRKECARLSRKISEKRVHDTRVALRRWFSVWRVLKADGWESPRCKRKLIKPLKKLQKLLGELRDIDVNLEQGERLGCTQRLMHLWADRRQQLKKSIEDYVDSHDIEGLIADLNQYLKKRARRVEAKLPAAKSSQTAFDHLELYLLHQESIVREEAETAQTPEDLHQLRLSIKRWRYLLTEFFGVTNIELVRAQQLLGQLHDLDRLTPILVHDDEQRQALLQLKEKRHQILLNVEEMRNKLPYGLRPHVSTARTAPTAAFEEPRT